MVTVAMRVTTVAGLVTVATIASVAPIASQGNRPLVDLSHYFDPKVDPKAREKN